MYPSFHIAYVILCELCDATHTIHLPKEDSGQPTIDEIQEAFRLDLCNAWELGPDNLAFCGTCIDELAQEGTTLWK